MKRPKPSRAGTAAARKPAPPPMPLAPRPWWFRLVAALSPLILLGAVELGLRLAGYGYPTSFFLERRPDGQTLLTENPRFAWRFFPQQVARTPRPMCFSLKKSAGTVRIFVLGESAAMGDPEAAYGFARQLERILQARHPERKIEVINAAMTGINSHVMVEIARDCAQREGDFWVVYAGNNEVIGPFGAGTIFGQRAARLGIVRLNMALKSTRLGQLLAALHPRSGEPGEWEGMEMFLGQQVCHDDPGLERVYGNFAANLRRTVEFGRKSGATVLLATVAVNLKDSPPFGSSHRAGLGPAELQEWEKCFARGAKAGAEGHFEAALSAYDEAARIDAEHAELAFQRARCELRLGRDAAALIDFQRACDLDTLRFRADSRLNQIIRQTAAEKGVRLVDVERKCAERAASEASTNPPAALATVPGEGVFYDHVHFSFSGNYAVAARLAAEVEKGWPNPSNGATMTAIPESQVAERLSWSEFDQRRVAEEMRLRLQQPPFSTQSNFRERDTNWARTIFGLGAIPASSAAMYRAAIAQAPQDWILHANFGRLLEAGGDAPGASAQWQEVTRLLPYYAGPWLELGRLAHKRGREGEAEGFLREALNRQPESPETLNEMGLVLAGEGRAREGMQSLRRALRFRPGYNSARINLAVLLAQNGDARHATLEYREVLRRDKNNVFARINLGNLLTREGQRVEARVLYEEVLRLQPDNPMAHYNLGRALAANGAHREAVPHFEATVRQRPDLADAHLDLGIELAQLGRDNEALEQFAEAARLKPDLVDAHFNYGVALAKSRRLAESVEQFRTTLRLQPTHPYAARALQQASRASN